MKDNKTNIDSKTLASLYEETIEALSTIIESNEAQRETEILIESLLGFSSTEITTKSDNLLTRNQIAKVHNILDERLMKRTPLAYLLEEAPFMNLKLFVNSDVLIPRPETELLVEKVLDEIKARRISKPSILDLGTGSGCIAIALKKYLPAATVYASDVSKASLNVAAINAKKNEADIKFIFGDYLEPFLVKSKKSSSITEKIKSIFSTPIFRTEPPYFDLIVSNPPYVNEEDYENLEAELKHEPKHALVGFPYALIKEQSQELLKPNGFLAFEYGIGQTEEMMGIFPESRIYQDYSGIDRILITK